ncbi:MAG: hypothetical protein J7L11_11135 [Thermoprotei archaeon]|nr:hypothetical protein [Thermoprotei archaeon]
MRRKYADLGIMIPPNMLSREGIDSFISLLKELDIKLVALTARNREEIRQLRDLARRYNEDVDIVVRLNISTEERSSLLKLLKARREVEVVAVECLTQSIARIAAKDSRVDLLYFPFKQRVSLGATEVRLRDDRATWGVELRFWDLVRCEKWILLQRIREAIALALSQGVPIVLTSGARDFLELRSPRDMAFILSLFDVNEEDAIKSIADNPFEIVKRNREKLSGSHVLPGVKVVGRDEGYEISTKVPGIESYQPRKIK